MSSAKVVEILSVTGVTICILMAIALFIFWYVDDKLGRRAQLPPVKYVGGSRSTEHNKE